MDIKQQIENELKKMVLLYQSPVSKAYRSLLLVQIQQAQWVISLFKDEKKPKEQKEEGKK